MYCNFGDIVLLNDLSLKYNNVLIHLLFNFTVYMVISPNYLKKYLKCTFKIGSGVWQMLTVAKRGEGLEMPKNLLTSYVNTPLSAKLKKERSSYRTSAC